jgi:hypothetical protein
MAVVAADFVAYGAASQALDEDSAVGGAIDLTIGIMAGVILNAREKLAVVSDNAGDTQDIIIRGRAYDGYEIEERLTVNGTTSVLGRAEFYRILDLVLTTAATGIITISKQSDASSVQTIAATMTRMTTLFKFAYTSEKQRITRYDKFFLKNTNGADNLQNAKVRVYYDPFRRMEVGLDAAKDSSTSIANRRTAPSGITFSEFDEYVDVPDDDLDSGESIGVWLKQTAYATESTSRPTATEATPKVAIIGVSS